VQEHEEHSCDVRVFNVYPIVEANESKAKSKEDQSKKRKRANENGKIYFLNYNLYFLRG
jgi:hypothetical protein